ncbi:hypothetical protein DFJ77DRAFT_442702 [Powellomyces hirtus]|nr:hypothetical protein DFJ77DRAFT_442702 [Powellomyces hirtus]
MLVYLNLFLATVLSRVLAWGANQKWYPFLPSAKNKPKGARPRVLVVGAGVSGVSAAAACVAAGVEVVIFEKEPKLGGVWARVNKTSSLQFQALFYRFNPMVRFTSSFPSRDEILHELHRVWTLYELESRTRFNTPVTSIDHDKVTNTYTVNGNAHEIFDGIISATGTCGDIQIPKFKNLENYKGIQAHSSKMDTVDLDLTKSCNITVLGSGASAVEVVDYVLNRIDGDESRLGPDTAQNQICITVVARSDKWIMPRGILLSSISSMIPTRLGYIFEFFLRRFWYGQELAGMTPDRPFYASTPCLNTRYLALIRAGRIRYIRGDIDGFTEKEVKVSNVAWDSNSMVGRPAHDAEAAKSASANVASDVVFFATGFKKPSNDFCSDSTWRTTQDDDPALTHTEEFKPPNLFCVAFPPSNPTMLFLNDAYVDAVATAGHIHIGVLTRLFLTFLLDPATRPTPHDAAEWVRCRRGPGDMKKRRWHREGGRSMLVGGYNRWDGGLDFYSYGELLYWVASTIAQQRNRWKYSLFVMGFNNSCGAKLAHAFPTHPASVDTSKNNTINAAQPKLTAPQATAPRVVGSIVSPPASVTTATESSVRNRKVEVGR